MSMKADNAREWFATCPKGVESLLAHELATLGADDFRETVAGVRFAGSWAVAYRACLWSRLANRVIWPLGKFDAADGDALYHSLRGIDWVQLFDSRHTIAVDFSGSSGAIRNTQFGAQRSKDAIVDAFVAAGQPRPNVDRNAADIRVSVRLSRGRVQVGIDLGGHSLHQRGYRLSSGRAPLKENLAAAILLRAGWPEMASRQGALIDPMCGSGTLLIEGAMMAADIAPGLDVSHWGFQALRDFDVPRWQALLSDAQGRAERGRAVELPEIRGYDASPRAVETAIENIGRAGLEKQVRVTARPLHDLQKPTHRPLLDGLIVTNPPYGERLGERESLPALYRLLGEKLVTEFAGWQAAVFTSELELGRAVGLRSHKRYRLFNGALETQLLLFDLKDNKLRDARPAQTSPEAGLSDGAHMFANRLRKNRKRLSSWLRKEGIECYRLYDADMPEYAVAVDVYGDYVHVAEYKAPATIPEETAARRLEEVRAALPQALEVPAERVVFKQRARQRGSAQYGKQADKGHYFTIREGAAKLRVNLYDYLDTGLFLDHRPLRLRLAREAQGKRFLNLFCYTGTASVHAALGGARSTTSIDLSNTYLNWLRENLALNDLDERANTVVRADCVRWLQESNHRYDLILLDPPSFSNSKSLDESFDVQRDHATLVRAAMARLAPDGCLYFSNNRQGFSLDEALGQAFDCVDITTQTLDRDFERRKKIHQCWQIRHASGAGR
ncbi:MAG: bifunctional 23S rRNA (guanine(2069)-N(7))-methyltransferase RlmK/23S rRNA (guanine(2445)-N(2))-methyltransferase RlmL [Halioglobus sp.]